MPTIPESGADSRMDSSNKTGNGGGRWEGVEGLFGFRAEDLVRLLVASYERLLPIVSRGTIELLDGNRPKF